jgi:hypothetical protein
MAERNSKKVVDTLLALGRVFDGLHLTFSAFVGCKHGVSQDPFGSDLFSLYSELLMLAIRWRNWTQ